MRIDVGAFEMLISVGMVASSSIASASEANGTSPWILSLLETYSPIIGLIGLFLGLFTVYEWHKDKARNARLNNWLDNNVAYSELTKEVEGLQENIEQLQGHRRDAEYYKKNIFPAAVRRVALKERAKTEAETVARSYLNYKKTMEELQEPPHEAEIPQHIKSDILVYLVPEYEEQKMREVRKDRITIISIALLIVNSIFINIFGGNMLYYSIQRFSNAVLGLILLVSLMQLVKAPFIKLVKRLLERSPDDIELQKLIQTTAKTSYVISTISVFLLGIVLLSSSIIASLTNQDIFIVLLFGFGGFISFAGGVYLFFIGKNQ